jgi:hypothetical protein
MDGFIFHLHPDRHSAVADVISSASGTCLAHKFKFRIRPNTQQRPTSFPATCLTGLAPRWNTLTLARTRVSALLNLAERVRNPWSQILLCLNSFLMLLSILSHI